MSTTTLEPFAQRLGARGRRRERGRPPDGDADLREADRDVDLLLGLARATLQVIRHVQDRCPHPAVHGSAPGRRVCADCCKILAD